MYPHPAPVISLAEASVTNAGSATARVDTRGYSRLSLILRQSTSNGVTNNLSVCKLSEGSDTNITSSTNITGFVGDTSFTIPDADTSNPQVYVFNLDLRGRQRYIYLTASPLTTQTFTAVWLLHRAKETPVTAAQTGVALLIEG